MSDCNAKKKLLELAGGEPFEAIVISKHDKENYDWSTPEYFGKEMIEEAFKVLDFEFDSGYGGEEGHRLYAWTPTKVIIKSVYDGSESYDIVPRHPSNVMPEAYGGG